MNQQSSITVRGTGAALLVPATVIAAAIIFMPVYLQAQGDILPAQNVLMIRKVGAAVAVVFGIAAGFLWSRRLELSNGVLRYQSWLGTKQWPATAITDITYEDDVFPELVDDGPFHWTTYLRLWSGCKRVLQLNYLYWRRKDLSRLVENLRRLQPELQIGPRARVYLNP